MTQQNLKKLLKTFRSPPSLDPPFQWGRGGGGSNYASSLSNLVYNLAKGIHKLKCKNEHDNKKCEMCGKRYKDCVCFLEYTNLKDDLIEYKCLCCNKNYEKKFDENLKLVSTIP